MPRSKIPIAHCPFCGSDRTRHRRRIDAVHCLNCGARGKACIDKVGKAIRSWNEVAEAVKRAPPAPKKSRLKLWGGRLFNILGRTRFMLVAATSQRRAAELITAKTAGRTTVHGLNRYWSPSTNKIHREVAIMEGVWYCVPRFAERASDWRPM